MNFVINNSKPFQNQIRTYKVLWRLYSRQYKIYIGFVLIIAFIATGIGVFSKYTFWIPNRDDGAYYNLNITYSIALAFFIVAIIYFRHMLKSKRAFFKIADKVAAEQPTNPIDRAIEVDDDSIKITGVNSKHEFRWKCFSHYKLADGILFILCDNSYLGAIAILQEEMNAADFGELLSVVKSRLPVKKR